MPGVVVDAFFLECSAQLCSVESPSNGLIRFEQLIIHDTKLIPPNTQHEFFPMNIRLGCRLKHGQIVPMISSSLGYRSGSIFHHQWLYDAKNPFIYAWQAAFHMWKIGVQRFSALIHMEPPNSCFWIIPNDFKRYEIVCWVTPNVSASSFCIWHESSSNNASNFTSSYTFGLPLCFRRQIHRS